MVQFVDIVGERGGFLLQVLIAVPFVTGLVYVSLGSRAGEPALAFLPAFDL